MPSLLVLLMYALSRFHNTCHGTLGCYIARSTSFLFLDPTPSFFLLLSIDTVSSQNSSVTHCPQSPEASSGISYLFLLGARADKLFGRWSCCLIPKEVNLRRIQGISDSAFCDAMEQKKRRGNRNKMRNVLSFNCWFILFFRVNRIFAVRS